MSFDNLTRQNVKNFIAVSIKPNDRHRIPISEMISMDFVSSLREAERFKLLAIRSVPFRGKRQVLRLKDVPLPLRPDVSIKLHGRSYPVHGLLLAAFAQNLHKLCIENVAVSESGPSSSLLGACVNGLPAANHFLRLDKISKDEIADEGLRHILSFLYGRETLIETENLPQTLA
uniref:BTB domain-containing protein n=1 Tax=Romanomermis culicivorax TaxID=13658 RepID=A0A915L7H9_ROMCU